MAAGPKLWNGLPAGIRQTYISHEQFKWLLKTFCLDAEIMVHCDYLAKLCLSINFWTKLINLGHKSTTICSYFVHHHHHHLLLLSLKVDTRLTLGLDSVFQKSGRILINLINFR